MVSELGPDQRDVRDATAPNDIRIQYRVEVRDSSDNVASVRSDWLILGDADPPAPPRNLQAVAGTQSASLIWIGSGSPGTTGYRVERAAYAGAAFESIGETDATNFADPAGRPGHVYRVLALDRSGNSSFPSATVIVR